MRCDARQRQVIKAKEKAYNELYRKVDTFNESTNIPHTTSL